MNINTIVAAIKLDDIECIQSNLGCHVMDIDVSITVFIDSFGRLIVDSSRTSTQSLNISTASCPTEPKIKTDLPVTPVNNSIC